MRFQPVNPNPEHLARHTLYLATTGGGKSQMLAQNPAIPKTGARVILWDQAGDHAGLHYNEPQQFVRALKSAIAKGGGFRIAYSGLRTIERYEWFCEVVWSLLDGNVETHLLVEELSMVCAGPGKASPNAAVLLNEGRKFGLIFHGTSQKPQEVAKTYFDQCAVKFIGQQKGQAMRKRMALELGITVEEVTALQPLQFYRDEGKADRPELITLKYRKRVGVRWMK